MSGISAIMVSWKTGPVLFDAIAAALADPDIAELILVDHENPDDVRTRLDAMAERDARLSILRTNKNLGFGRGNNLAAREAEGEFLFFINPDTRLEIGAAGKLCGALSEGEAPVIAGALILGDDGREQSGSRRETLTLWRAFVTFTGLSGLCSVLGRSFRPFGLDNTPLPSAPMQVGAVSGAAMMVSKADFLRLGGFDEGYFLHVEDVDLCRRAQSVLFVPDAVVHHIGGTSKASAFRVQWEKAKSFLRYFWKFERGIIGRIATIMMAPLIVMATLIRAIIR